METIIDKINEIKRISEKIKHDPTRSAIQFRADILLRTLKTIESEIEYLNNNAISAIVCQN